MNDIFAVYFLYYLIYTLMLVNYKIIHVGVLYTLMLSLSGMSESQVLGFNGS